MGPLGQKTRTVRTLGFLGPVFAFCGCPRFAFWNLGLRTFPRLLEISHFDLNRSVGLQLAPFSMCFSESLRGSARSHLFASFSSSSPLTPAPRKQASSFPANFVIPPAPQSQPLEKIQPGVRSRLALLALESPIPRTRSHPRAAPSFTTASPRAISSIAVVLVPKRIPPPVFCSALDPAGPA